MSQIQPLIARVAVPSPLRRTFDYLVTADSDALQPGCRVKVPFGNREVTGLVIQSGHTSELPLDQLKPVSDILDQEPLLPKQLFKLYTWAASYYQHPIGDALLSTLPVLLRKGDPLPDIGELCWQLSVLGKGLGKDSLKRAKKQRALIDLLFEQGTVSEEEILQHFSRSILKQLKEKSLVESVFTHPEQLESEHILKQQPLDLYPAQQQAIEKIDLHSFGSYLLDGVTGSGKTEIYLQSIEKVLRYQRQALVLIPEISLTPQTEKRFRDRFNVPIATLHSSLTDKQRLNAWMQARNGSAKIILGTRSAIFTPLKIPGLIILDEEHDPSYKQQDGFRYSARDLAVIRAREENLPVILGSATPSLESLNNTQSGRYTHLSLPTRAGDAMQPEWHCVDLKTETMESGISASTLVAIREELSQKNQVLVFLNRRGFAPAMLCHHCGWVAECPRCDARLTVHKSRGRLICHHCDYQQRFPKQCPDCKGHQFIPVGEGTERSEDWLQACFPDIPILRVDRDTTRKKGAMQAMYDTADSGEPCILLGTQMLAKGHHFPNVTLVAILDADSGLFSPDFRSHERLGQLLTQVAGRSGRGDKPGRVFIQTHQPDHPLLDLLIQQGYPAFAAEILSQRQMALLPPYHHLAAIRAESSRAEDAETFLYKTRQLAQSIAQPTPQFSYLGPLPASMEKRANRFRYLLQICVEKRSDLQSLLRILVQEMESLPDSKRVRWAIDVDPLEL